MPNLATNDKIIAEIKDRLTRKRTGNELTDLACKGRERQTNPKAKENNQQYENCKVCGKSFKKGRGLNIHMSLTSCRSILEGRSRICKSKFGSPQETNHSGSTKGNNLPENSSSAQECVKKKESATVQCNAKHLEKGVGSVDIRKYLTAENNQNRQQTVKMKENLYMTFKRLYPINPVAVQRRMKKK